MSCILILAGGLGKRMKSEIPKVLHKLNDISILSNIIQKFLPLNRDIYIVVGKYEETIKTTLLNELGNLDNIKFCRQDKSLGTGHALQSAIKNIKKYKGVVVINGDVPFIKQTTIENMLNSKNDSLLGVCKLDVMNKEWFGHGRIILDGNYLDRIVEEKDCNDEQRQIKIINGGLYYFKMKPLLELCDKLDNNNKQQEYYITDYISIFKTHGYNFLPIYLEKNEVLNINTPEQLNIAKRILNNK